MQDSINKNLLTIEVAKLVVFVRKYSAATSPMVRFLISGQIQNQLL